VLSRLRSLLLQTRGRYSYSRNLKSRSVEQNGTIAVDGKVLDGVLHKEEDGRMRLG
jgi:hypothetical protein